MKNRRKDFEYVLADKATRTSILIRDKHICKLCRKKPAMDVHEIIPRSQLHDLKILFSERNRIALCRDCHDTVPEKEKLFSILVNDYGYIYPEEVFRRYVNERE